MERERTGPQPLNPGKQYPTAYGQGMLRANGGTYGNPMGFPGYDTLYTGGYETYRWVLQHPIVQLVDAIAVGPILTSEWEYEKADKGVPDRDVELIRTNLDPIRTNLLNNFYRQARRYGWAGGELRWEVSQRKSETRLVGIKPLLHDITEILQDKNGNATGLVNYRAPEGSGKTEVRLPMPFKSYLYTYDPYAGNLYGRSWLENIRATAWKDWLDAAQQLQMLGAKISGITSVVISPPGEFLDANGNRISYQKNAEVAIGAIADGAAGVWFPSIALAIDERGNIDAIKLMAELAGKSLTKIETLDFGNNAPAIKGQLERMIHAEELIFAGGLRPSRSGLQGSSGGDRGQSEAHQAMGDTIAEIDDQDFASSLQPVVNAILQVNRGEGRDDTVRVKPPPLAQRLAATIKAVLLAMLNDPLVVQEMARSLDMDKMTKVLGMSTKKPFDQSKIEQPKPPVSSPEKPPRTPEPQGGRPTKVKRK